MITVRTQAEHLNEDLRGHKLIPGGLYYHRDCESIIFMRNEGIIIAYAEGKKPQYLVTTNWLAKKFYPCPPGTILELRIEVVEGDSNV